MKKHKINFSVPFEGEIVEIFNRESDVRVDRDGEDAGVFVRDNFVRTEIRGSQFLNLEAIVFVSPATQWQPTWKRVAEIKELSRSAAPKFRVVEATNFVFDSHIFPLVSDGGEEIEGSWDDLPKAKDYWIGGKFEKKKEIQ